MIGSKDGSARVGGPTPYRSFESRGIRGTIFETRSPAGPILWEGLTYWLSNSSEPLSREIKMFIRVVYYLLITFSDVRLKGALDIWR